MRGNVGFWRISYYFVISLRTTHFTFHNFLHLLCNARSRFRGNILILLMYSDCINAVDPHTIIPISFVLWLYYMFCLTDGFVVLCSIHAVDFLISALFLRITKGILCLHNSEISLGILLILLLSHVEIWIFVIANVFGFCVP
jgi:hypothetical protein